MAEDKNVVTKKTRAAAAETKEVAQASAPGGATVTKKTTAKKTASKKTAARPATDAPVTEAASTTGASTVKKKTAAKKTTTKKTVAKKAGTSRAPTPMGSVTPEQRYKMIQDAAYYRAEKRGFAPGHEQEDWAAAEREVEELLRAQKKP